MFGRLVAATAILLAALIAAPALSLDQPVVETRPAGGELNMGSACDLAPVVFDPLCEAHHVIVTQYVDPVDEEALATAAAKAVREAGLPGRAGGEPPLCPLPAAVYEELCTAIDAIEDTEAAVHAAIRGMARSLDANSDYMTPEEYERFRSFLANRATAGLGMEFALMENGAACLVLSAGCRPVIVEVHPGGPAAGAGLMVGDQLVKLGDAFPAELGCAEVARLDRFEEGASVAVTVLRGEQTVAATIRAENLTIPVARGKVVDGDVGYLRLDIFSDDADDRVRDVLDDLTAPYVSGLVLDLRNNPGGYVASALEVAGLFLRHDSVILHEESRGGRQSSRSRGATIAPDPGLLPMAVVVNRGSASASELVIGALLDYGRVTLVGTTTFGKNTGQITRRLKQGDMLAGVLKLTTIRLLTPEMGSVAGGIHPDVEMDLPMCLPPDEVARRAVSAVRPHVVGVGITSRPSDGLAYRRGETVQVTVTFSSEVMVGRNGGIPLVRLGFGSDARFAPMVSGDGSSDLLFEYAVSVGDVAPDGIAIRADSLRPNGASIRHPAGLDALAAHNALPADPIQRVRASAPVAGFADTDGNPHHDNILRIAAAGITTGCNTNHYCPNQPVTRDQMATFLARALNLTTTTNRTFTDIENNPHHDNILRIAAAGITTGCNTNHYCPNQPVTRDQMATFLARALNLTTTTDRTFTDIENNPHHDNILRIAAAGITTGCNTNHYCPNQPVTRDQMATFLARALELISSG